MRDRASRPAPAIEPPPRPGTELRCPCARYKGCPPCGVSLPPARVRLPPSAVPHYAIAVATLKPLVSTIPWPRSFLQERGPPALQDCTAQSSTNFLTSLGWRWGKAGSYGYLERSAATTPVMTGHAADVPASGVPAPKASEPR